MKKNKLKAVNIGSRAVYRIADDRMYEKQAQIKARKTIITNFYDKNIYIIVIYDKIFLIRNTMAT